MAFLTCKAYQTARLGAAVAPLVRGPLVSLQNGLGNVQKLERCHGQVVAALTSHGITVEAPGRLRHAGTGVLKVGPHRDVEAAKAVHGILEDAGLSPSYHDEMRGHIWQKAIVNAGINPVAAMHGVRNGALLESPLWDLTQRLVEEAVALAKRARVELPPGDLVDVTRQVCEATAANKVSMLQDMEAKRPTEIEQITGRMVRLAETLLVSMPRNESVYGRIKDMESELLGPERSQQTAWDETAYLGDLV